MFSQQRSVTPINFDELKRKYRLLENQPALFAYNLRVSDKKYLPGTQRFYVELNAERSSLRRPPQEIKSLNPKFEQHKFNFKKVNPMEVIMTIPHKNHEISLIINNSPLTPFHTLICQDVKQDLVQRITLESLSFAVELLLNLEKSAFRIGYNSPGALASVNHLHLHLIYVEPELYIDEAKLEHLSGSYIFRLSAAMPTEALCFIIYKTDSEAGIDLKLRRLHDLLMWLCQKNKPHNLFMTLNRKDSAGALKIFVFAREKFWHIKDIKGYNLGFCELSGYIPVGDKDAFNSLTEHKVIAKIREETGNVYTEIYSYFVD